MNTAQLADIACYLIVLGVVLVMCNAHNLNWHKRWILNVGRIMITIGVILGIITIFVRLT